MKIHVFAVLALALMSGVLIRAAELPGTSGILIPENGPLEKDHAALRMSWAEKHLLPEAEKRWQGQPWAEQARVVTQKGLALWFNGLSESDKDADKTAAAARELVRTECEEPLACLMAHKILWQLKQDWWGGSRGLNKAFKIVNDEKVPAALRVWIVDEQIDRLKATNWRYNDYHKKQVDRIVQAVSSASYAPEFEPVLVRDFLDWMENLKELDEASFEKLAKAVRESPLSEWTRACLLGDVHVHWAWFIRGGSAADEVRKDAWGGFREHLEKAGEHLKKAHELRPERPEAAGRMIQVVMGTNGDEEEQRAWFDRAIAAQFDYRNAYTGLIYASTKRWGGSDGLVLTLGKRFAETKRYDTDVPEQFFHACKQIVIESGNPRGVFSHPLVRESALVFARGLQAHEETNPARAARLQGLSSVVAWLAGYDELAQRGVSALDREFPASVTRDLNEMLLHPSMLRTSVFAGQGGWGEGLRQLEHEYRERDVEAMKTTLAKLKPESLPTENARNYVELIRAEVELPEKLKEGGWQPLPIYSGLSTCRSSGGHWRVTAPGEITLTGSDAGFVDLAFPIWVDKALEIRGEVTYELNAQTQWFAHWSFGPSLRWSPVRSGIFQIPDALRGLTYHPKKGDAEARVTGAWTGQFKGKAAVQLKPVNTFQASLSGNEMSFTFNDGVMPPQDIESFGLRNSRGLAAFTGINVPTGVKIKISKLEVRVAGPTL